MQSFICARVADLVPLVLLSLGMSCVDGGWAVESGYWLEGVLGGGK